MFTFFCKNKNKNKSTKFFFSTCGPTKHVRQMLIMLEESLILVKFFLFYYFFFFDNLLRSTDAILKRLFRVCWIWNKKFRRIWKDLKTKKTFFLSGIKQCKMRFIFLLLKMVGIGIKFVNFFSVEMIETFFRKKVIGKASLKENASWYRQSQKCRENDLEFFLVIQWAPLKGITLGPRETDSYNPLILISEQTKRTLGRKW